mgnify:CR=1 FL=1
MSYLRVNSYSAGRNLAAAMPGDVVSLAELLTTVTGAGAQTITAAALAGQVILRTGAGVVSDITDTAVNIMQSMYGNVGSEPMIGEGFLSFFSNQGASTVTITGGVGVTVSGNSAVLANTMKTFFVVCTAPGVKTFSAGIYTNVGATFNVICL